MISYHRPHTDLLKPWLSVAAYPQRFLCAVAPLKLKDQMSNTSSRLKVEKRLQTTRGKSQPFIKMEKDEVENNARLSDRAKKTLKTPGKGDDNSFIIEKK